MNRRRSAIIIAALTALGLVCGLAGGAVGYRLGRDAARDQADPETWHERASRRFQEVVHPTPEQGERLDAHLQTALTELREIRKDTIARSAAAIDRLVARVESELTPAQKAAFEKLKPRHDEVGLEVLKTE